MSSTLLPFHAASRLSGLALIRGSRASTRVVTNSLIYSLAYRHVPRRFNSSAPAPPAPPAPPASQPKPPAPTEPKSEPKSEPKHAVPGKPEEKKMTLWEKVKHEAQHYWDGTKLLGLEIRISTKLALRMMAGYELTRRESRQLQRTIQDITRLVPFSVFIIVPFAELLLPVALKLFPNLLPSTYESGKDKEKKLKRLRKTRSQVSEFLRKTVAESGMRLPTATTEEQKKDFAEFFRQVRSSGETPSRDLLLRVARLFKDDTVLDNLSRPQLVAISKYINIQPFGSNLMLRYRIRYKLLQIKKDDRAIDYEGVDSLSTTELQAACASRGIRTHGVSPAKLRDDLQVWLDLRLRDHVPATLLVLSSAFTYGSSRDLESQYDALYSVLSAIPEELLHEAEVDVASTDATNKQRLNLIKEQEALIKEETAQEKESGHIIQVKDVLSLDEIDKEDAVKEKGEEGKEKEEEKKEVKKEVKEEVKEKEKEKVGVASEKK